MSAYGYGSSYQPLTPLQNSPTIAQTVPGYQGVAPMPTVIGAVNWNPQANAAWGDMGNYTYAWDQNKDNSATGRIAQGITGHDSTKYTAEQHKYPWQNVISSMFGQGSQFNLNGANEGNGNQYTMPTAGNQDYGANSPWHPTQNYAGGLNDPAYQNQFGNSANAVNPNQPKAGADPMNNPQSVQQLYQQIQGLSTGQLQHLSSNFNNISTGFGYAAQEYANAYGNQNYMKQNPLNPMKTTDWLQASYNTLTNRLNDNGLL